MRVFRLFRGKEFFRIEWAFSVCSGGTDPERPFGPGKALASGNGASMSGSGQSGDRLELLGLAIYEPTGVGWSYAELIMSNLRIAGVGVFQRSINEPLSHNYS